MPAVVAVGFFIIYYVVMITGEKTAKEGIIDVYQGMWLPTAILLPLGIFLTSKATSDSVLFDVYSYGSFIKKIIGVDKIKKRKRNSLLKSYSEQASDDAILLERLSELNSLTSEYGSNVLRRITFGYTIKDYFKIKEKEKLSLIFKIYKEVYVILLYRAKGHKYFNEKLTEFPSYKLLKLKSNFVKMIVKIILVVIVPVWLVYILYHKITIHRLRTKLKLMNNLSNDITNVIKDKGFLNLKK